MGTADGPSPCKMWSTDVLIRDLQQTAVGKALQ